MDIQFITQLQDTQNEDSVNKKTDTVLTILLDYLFHKSHVVSD